MTPQQVEPISYATPEVNRRRWRAWPFVLLLVVIVLLCAVLLLFLMYFARSSAVSMRITSATVATAVTMPGAPVELTIMQRQSGAIPGSNGQVLVRIGDITGGQVLVSISQADGTMLMPTTSMRKSTPLQFLAGSETYTITAKELRNFLAGDDFAVFVISPATNQLSESDKIEALIAHVSGLDGAVFIRNGQEHPPADAAKHVRQKWTNAKDQIQTAQDFITRVASRSSMSGEAYRVRLKDGSEVTAEELLSAELARLEGKAMPTTSPLD